jgi:hypothetical protein
VVKDENRVFVRTEWYYLLRGKKSVTRVSVIASLLTFRINRRHLNSAINVSVIRQVLFQVAELNYFYLAFLVFQSAEIGALLIMV